MKKLLLLLVPVVLIAVVVAWYLFRPELLFINATVAEAAPTTRGPDAIVARGNFHGVVHQTKGTATVHRLSNGKQVLRLTDFETSNGPALRVYLIAAEDAADSDAVKRVDVLDLGVLKGNIGDQNYELPAEADLNKYKAATIWCQRFSVNFATAPLVPAEGKP